MKKEEYISIKEFSERANVSVQSIYKRLNGLNNPLNQYIKLVDNQKMLNIRALQEVYGIEVEQPIQPNYSTYSTSDSTDKVAKEVSNFGGKELIEVKHQLELAELEIKHLQAQIKDKSEQIHSLHQRLEESHKLLDQQQQLCAMNQKKIEELEDKKDEPQQKKSWWKFWK